MIEQRGKHTYIPQRASLPPQHKHRPVLDDVEDDEAYSPVRPPRSAIRYTTTQDQVIQQGNRRIVIHHGMPPPRHSPQQQAQQTEPEARRPHWLLFAGLVMLLMLIGWILV